eukprot:TRINITY_DN61124_c0_g1_i1.p1 TRINITY_DN61124_c0_g1~~TRINITY_DN61124_c0_g1_i1.p1  ORF type:complete len:461 (-),score=96.79 TRINITY_DN61124_c0_g1_i1:33-1415(-)
MPRCCFTSKICNVDLDETFAYTVPAQTVVKDARLGILQYTFFFLIFLYVVVFQVVMECGYLAKPDADLVLRSTLRAPKALTAAKDLAYCRDPEESSQDCRWFSSDLKKCPCQVFPGEDAMYSEGNNVDILTSRLFVDKVLDGSSIQHIERKRIFTRDIENYTILLEPNVVSKPKTPTEPTHVYPGSKLQGRLYVGLSDDAETRKLQHALCAQKGRDARDASDFGAEKTSAPCYVKSLYQVAGNDIFAVSDFLAAAGLRLDTRGPWGSHREHGSVIMVQIHLVNYREWFGFSNEHYVVKPLLLHGSKYKREYLDQEKTEQSEKKVAIHDAGLHFVFSSTGTFAYFSLPQLLKTLTESVGLLAVAGAAVKFIAVYAMPMGRYYYHAMTQETPDFDLIEDMHAQMERESRKVELVEKHFETFGHLPAKKEKMVFNMIDAHCFQKSEAGLEVSPMHRPSQNESA